MILRKQKRAPFTPKVSETDFYNTQVEADTDSDANARLLGLPIMKNIDKLCKL